jgi:hypothetical protein
MRSMMLEDAGAAAVKHLQGSTMARAKPLQGADSGTNLMRSNMEPAGEVFSIIELEQQARAMRAVYIFQLLKWALTAIDNWFARRAQRDLEDYLAESQNLADLEARMRRYAARRAPFNLA